MHQRLAAKAPARVLLLFDTYLLIFLYMSPEGYRGFKPTEVNLGPRQSEKAPPRVANDESPEAFQKYSPQEMQTLDSRVFNRLPPWAEDLSHPVYQDLPEEVAELMYKVAQAPVTNTEDVASLVKILDKRWDEWDEKQG